MTRGMRTGVVDFLLETFPPLEPAIFFDEVNVGIPSSKSVGVVDGESIGAIDSVVDGGLVSNCVVASVVFVSGLEEYPPPPPPLDNEAPSGADTVKRIDAVAPVTTETLSASSVDWLGALKNDKIG